MATSVNPLDLYHNPALDSLVFPDNGRARINGTNRRYSGSNGNGRRPLSQEIDPAVFQPPPAAPQVPRGPPISYRGFGSQGQGQNVDGSLHRSFSQRAKGRPFHQEAFADTQEDPMQSVRPKQRIVSEPIRSDALPKVARKAVPTDGLRLNTSTLNGPSSSRAPRREVQSARDPAPVETNPPQQSRRTSDTPRRTEEPVSAVSKSSAFRDEAQRRDWAPDRSPLQKLEVTLNDISKEEKRARVQEAEMLLRDREARKTSGVVSSPREVGPSTKSIPTAARSISKRERPVEVGAPTLEDAGLVRNLSTTQRQRLQHSTTIDSRRPDVRSLSGEGQAGFEYTISSPPQPAPTTQRRQSSREQRRQSDTMSDREPVASPTVAAEPTIRSSKIRSGKQREIAPLTEPERSDNVPGHVPQQDPEPRERFANFREDSFQHQKNASHKAALEKLTGVSTPVGGAQNGSRRLQKPRSEGSDARAVPAAKTPSRIPVPSSGTAPQYPRTDAYNQTAANPKSALSQSLPQPRTPPVGLGLHSAPIPGSPQSPPAKPVDVIRQRQRKSSVSFREPLNNRPVDEWKEAGTARLTVTNFSTETTAPIERGKTWWEQPATSPDRRRSRSAKTSEQQKLGDPIDDKTAEFRPNLYLRCGPLLRYKGMKRLKHENGEDREIWRGSVLIVTQNSASSYDPAPVLRIFSQPQRLLPPPPHHTTADELQPEYVDPIAGLTKLSRTGRALYVRPVDHLQEGKDLSQIENDDGLFESSPSPLEPHGSSGTAPIPNQRNLETDGEKLGRYQEVAGARLYADPDRDVTFWRFNLEIELAEEQQHIAYRINRGPAVGFWVPARGQTMHIMFHTCNGFSMSVNPDNFNGPDPMWRDVLNTHQTKPFHVMIGGGDQIYNDRVMLETQHFGDWTRMRNPQHKHHAPFTHEMKEELETFYLNRYSMWFSQGFFGMAGSQIPMVNIWDDHDIIDGFGSYPNHFMETPVFSGVGNVAFKYYMLFQHQSVPEETTIHEPSWILGRQPGPYIKQLSRSLFMHLGKHVAFLGLDCRTERKRNEIVTLATLDHVLERCRKELVEGETKHLIVLLGVPIAYPRLVWLENVLTSRLMDPVKALGRAGIIKGGFLNKFDGGVEILDDLDDHWTATNHKHERNELIKDLQDLAAERSCRITILSGDVHLAAIGQFHSNPKLKIPKDRDHRYMPNVISSAIVNTPPSDMLADVLNKRNKVHHLDHYTDENMIPMFTHDVNDKKRNNKQLLPRRNWCSIREYMPGSTPPPSPPQSLADFQAEDEEEELEAGHDPKPRRFSFSKEDVNPRTLLRRLSSRNAPPTSYRDTMYDQGRSASYDGVTQPYPSIPAQSQNRTGSRQSSADSQAPPNQRASSFDHTSSGMPVRPTGAFKRRPTNLSEKAAKKGNVPAIDAEGNEIDVNDNVNLEGGLDIVLNVEVNQKDPSGITMPYRLLVPALWYDGSSDREKLEESNQVQRKPTLMNRLVGLGGKRTTQQTSGQEGDWNEEETDEEDEGADPYAPKPGAAPPRRRFSLFGNRRQKKEEYASDYDDEGEPEPQENGPQMPQPPRRQQMDGALASNPGNPSRHGDHQMSHNMAGPPNHDMLYDTENLPPPSHRLEPASHPSVRRSLTISGHQSRSNPSEGSGGHVHESYPSPPSAPPPPPAPMSQPTWPASLPSELPNAFAGGRFPERRLSKQERVLGIGSSDPQPISLPPQPLRGNGIIGKDFRQTFDPPSQRGTIGLRGYSGVEAYKEPKARRAFSLKKARDWFDGRPRDEEYDD